MQPTKRLTKKDISRIQEGYNRKFKEYEAMGLDELIVLRDSKSVKGSYLAALERMIEIKERIKNAEV